MGGLFATFIASLLLTLVVSRPVSANTGLNSDAFMQMLLTQLQYQDPTEPMDSVDMVAQLSDLAMMEQNEEVVYAMNALKDQMYTSQGLYASNLVGKEVMVIANLFIVEEGRLPEGEILLSYAAESLDLEIYLDESVPDEEDPIDVLALGEQLEDGQVLYDLDDLDDPLPDDTYMMYAYAQVDGQQMEMMVVQRSVVLSVVIPGGGQDVLVDVEGIGLVPLYAITEFEGEYTADDSGGDGSDGDPVFPLPGGDGTPVLPGPGGNGNPVVGVNPEQAAQNQALNVLVAQLPRRMRGNELWTVNPFFKGANFKKRKSVKPVSQRAARFRTLP